MLPDVTGELDLFTVADLAESAAAALKTPAERYVLDLSRLSFIDCCGVRVLAAITRTIPAGCPVIVRSVSPAVRRVLDLMGLNLESRTMVPGNGAARLVLESQRIRSLAQQAMADSRTIATLGCLVSQALSLRVPGEGLRAAEDRGFEPRRVVTPNRISSAAP